MIGISSPRFSLTPFEEMLEKIAGDFELWEIVVEGEHGLGAIERSLSDEGQSYKLRYQFHAPLSDVNISSLDPDVRELSIGKLEATVGLANRLGIDIVTIHPGHLSPLGVMARERVKELNDDAYARLSRTALEHGVTVALENMPPMWITTYHTLESVVDAVEGTELRICLDVGHANIAGELGNIDSVVPLLANVHVHDNHGDKDRHLPIGEGDIDFGRIMSSLDGRYAGNWVYECREYDEGPRGVERLRAISDGTP